MKQMSQFTMMQMSLLALIAAISVGCSIHTGSNDDSEPPRTWFCSSDNSLVYDDAYNFAKDSSGLWLNSYDAQKFASNMSGRFCARESLEAFKSTFNFATSSQGLWIGREEARVFANKVSVQPNPITAFDCYREDFQFATRSNGLWLSKEEAHRHAVQKCRIY